MPRWFKALLLGFLALAIWRLVDLISEKDAIAFSVETFNRAPEIIRNMLPWDVGGSRWLLWGSVALFCAAALVVSRLFGWLCGRAAEAMTRPPA